MYKHSNKVLQSNVIPCGNSSHLEQFKLTEFSSKLLNKEEKHQRHIILVKDDTGINSPRFFSIAHNFKQSSIFNQLTSYVTMITTKKRHSC